MYPFDLQVRTDAEQETSGQKVREEGQAPDGRPETVPRLLREENEASERVKRVQPGQEDDSSQTDCQGAVSAATQDCFVLQGSDSALSLLFFPAGQPCSPAASTTDAPFACSVAPQSHVFSNVVAFEHLFSRY